ncbi:multidrug effflux MFS transporter [Pseudoxanthomonas sp.]|uniref:multidrug effflux MFS transporter n=1 Tax=Pseudoxanthomonas sp. TaxID=1871049 RepID=UPI00261E29AD|nr:multidrug effflux MFS transporter [Pseudoxanthomonas sp.]WDS35129.1 MAG: multidrug effflux MFS transporter [Pseudoxanthomonas sp.]
MSEVAERDRRAVRHAPPRLVLLLGALSAFAPFATDMYLSGFPAIARDLHTDVAHVQMSLSSFFLGLCVGQLLYGPMTDAWGRRGPLLVGIWLFTVTSLLLVLSPHVELLIGVRALQAVGGCAGMIVARAVIQDLMEPREAARTLSTMMMVQGLGPVLAPLLGGWLLALAGWRSVFVFLALFGGACLISVWRGLPETLPSHRRRPLHLGDSLRTFAALLRMPGFIVPALTGATAMAAMFAYIAGSPYVFMSLHGVSQQHYGWLFAFNAVGMIIAGRVNVVLLRRLSPIAVLRVAVCVMAATAATLLILRDSPALPLLVAPLFVCIGCVPMVAANSVALAMGVGRFAAGSASSLVGALQFGLAAAASALVGTLDDGSALPMTAVMLGCAGTAVVLAWWPRRAAAA